MRIYDAGTATETFAVTGPGELSTPVFSPDGARFVALARDGVVRAYDARTGTVSFALKDLESEDLPAFSPDGTRLAVADRKGVVRIFDARMGAEMFSLKASVKLNSPVFSPDGARLAAAGADQVVRVYNMRTNVEAIMLKGPTHLNSPVFSPDGTRLAAWGTDGAVRVYDARSAVESLTLQGPAGLGMPTFSPDGTRLAVSPLSRGFGGDQFLRLYDAQTGIELLALDGSHIMHPPAYSADGTRLAAAAADKVIQIYDARTGTAVRTIKGPPFQGDRMFQMTLMHFFAFGPDGTRLAVEGNDSAVRVYDTRTGAELVALKGPPLGSPVFSPDGTRLSVVGTDERVRVYDLQTGMEAFTLTEPASFIAAIVFSPDGARLAAAGKDGTVGVYDARTGTKTGALKGPAGLGFPAFSPDGTRLMAVGEDAVARLHDARSGVEVLALRGRATARSPVFSAMGSRLAVVGEDGVIRVYEAPRDTAAWQRERRQVLANSILAWHRAQADESEQAGQWFTAGFHWGRLTQAEPAQGPYHFRLGFALAHQGRIDAAKKEFQIALRLKKDLANMDLADAQAMLGKWDEAARLFEKARRAAPVDSVSFEERYATLAILRSDREGYRKACAMLTQRFQTMKGTDLARDLAWTCALAPDALPDPKGAIEPIRAAVQANPQDPNDRNKLGAILYRAGKINEAMSELSEATKLRFGGEAWADCLFLAMAYHQLGQSAKARQWLERELQAKSEPWVTRSIRLERQLLRREAMALINGAASKQNK
jgi:WD40 repeat protein/tetratricopeptide (TPR) repeat protein